VTLVTSIVVLAAAALAPVFGADWRPLVIAGGGGVGLAAAGLWWAASRLRSVLTLERTRDSIKETWRWVETRLRYAKTSRSPAAR
jgi:hypothetical protein